MYSANFAKVARLLELIPAFVKEIKRKTHVVKPTVSIDRDQQFLEQLETDITALAEKNKETATAKNSSRFLLGLAR